MKRKIYPEKKKKKKKKFTVEMKRLLV